MHRRMFLAGLLALAASGAPVDALAGSKPKRRRRIRGMSGGAGARGTADDGKCPCNGGKVCVGPRGGRYCITSSGGKRYGV